MINKAEQLIPMLNKACLFKVCKSDNVREFEFFFDEMDKPEPTRTIVKVYRSNKDDYRIERIELSAWDADKHQFTEGYDARIPNIVVSGNKGLIKLEKAMAAIMRRKRYSFSSSGYTCYMSDPDLYQVS